MLTLTLCLTSVLAVVYGLVDFSSFISSLQSSENIFGSSLNLTGFDYDAWWGSSEYRQDNTSITEFKVVFDDKMIQDLKYRLKHRRPITPSLEGTWFEYGINTNVAEDWLDYWENGYPFKEREDFINKYPHYVTNIQGLDIHFIRARPEAPKNVEVVPLLLLTGWPSSFAEFYGVIPLLAMWSKERDFAVEVIAPTIPGFPLSEATKKPGLGAPEGAVLFRKLMHRLGHKTYYMASVDLGYFFCNFIATAYPEDVRGFFTKFAPVLSISSILASTTPLLNGTIYFGGTKVNDILQHLSYLPHQATTPDSLGIAFNESPSGLLGYLLQFFYFGHGLDKKENAGVKIEKYIPRDVLLDNIMLYWMTGSIGTSMRIYAETFNRRVWAMNIDGTPSPVPTLISEPKSEIVHLPYSVLKKKYPNLISNKNLDFGGHFFPYEYPEYYANEILTAITVFREKTN